MRPVEQQFAAFGFPAARTDSSSWVVRRVGAPPRTARTALVDQPHCRRALVYWRDLLARDERIRPYRITRIG